MQQGRRAFLPLFASFRLLISKVAEVLVYASVPL